MHIGLHFRLHLKILLFRIVTTSQPYYATMPPSIDDTTPKEVPFWEDYDNRQIIVHHAPPTQEPYPTVGTSRPQVIYENYDTKYNVYDSEPEPKAPVEGEEDGKGHKVTKAAAPVTVLVIGIIAGAVIAVVLIVIIVLKMRTRSENTLKVDESARTYQFAPAGGPGLPTSSSVGGGVNSVATPSVNGDDFETPSIVGISNVPGTKATVTPASNGFYEKYVNNNKKNNSGKPVREWYV